MRYEKTPHVPNIIHLCRSTANVTPEARHFVCFLFIFLLVSRHEDALCRLVDYVGHRTTTSRPAGRFDSGVRSTFLRSIRARLHRLRCAHLSQQRAYYVYETHIQRDPSKRFFSLVSHSSGPRRCSYANETLLWTGWCAAAFRRAAFSAGAVVIIVEVVFLRARAFDERMFAYVGCLKIESVTTTTTTTTVVRRIHLALVLLLYYYT